MIPVIGQSRRLKDASGRDEPDARPADEGSKGEAQR
jgi:cell division transport system ATP-binding protein